ncbi:DoxX-like family protein [Halobacillus salinarum]|uniref:DoxX-like family protein n=1 Tax=Halobacillus salinarum TaxID=2932257 RepID=A0ABY4EMB3_9BACI|nr:DoxX-like family protein [Halobacillus salinarum]UOQ45594.1 DoxX-like family protein [Halobacillus salinarum]
MKRKPIYVEIPIEAEMDDLWSFSQDPDLHQQWDLRFSSITYLPKTHESDPQEFEYKTNIGFGLKVEGWGRSVGSYHSKDGSRTSALHFGSDQSMSLITEGKGYWKYVENNHSSLTFLTQYDYKTRFGKFGEWLDFCLFRPLIGWATAVSFDVLKRWLEKGETPASQYIRFSIYWLLTYVFAFVWLYHGLVPKLLNLHPEEINMAKSLLSFHFIQPSTVVVILGIIEIIFGLLWLFTSKRKRLFMFQIIIFPVLTVSAVLGDSSTLIHPFSPLTFNLCLFILSLIGLMITPDIPTAESCKRRR